MTNLEYMKQSIFNQINAMTTEDFYSFMYLLADNNDSNSLDLSGMLTCDDCKNTYGPCPDQSYLCVERFTQYCNQSK
jgi:hypothetical protein